jgi:hypothetical protein
MFDFTVVVAFALPLAFAYVLTNIWPMTHD